MADTFHPTRLTGESAEYVACRAELQAAEIELMRQRERVAQLRRDLPPGAAVQDYVFQEGPARLSAGDEPVSTVRLSQLFRAPERPLIIYHFMYGKRQTNPCPMCTQWIDGFNAIGHHLEQNADFAIVAAAPPAMLRAYARTRGWSNIRLLSAGYSTFKYDLRSEDETGEQDSTVSVFTLDVSGAVRHHYSSHPRMSEDIPERGLDLLCPTWHLLDLTPQGRGDWYSSVSYESQPAGWREG